VIWVRVAAAKKFGATEFVNPKDFNKPIQEVKNGWWFRVQQNVEPCLQNGQSCGVHENFAPFSSSFFPFAQFRKTKP
jgi:hypothetical protein